MLPGVKALGEMLGIDTQLYSRDNGNGTITFKRMDPITRKYNVMCLRVSEEQMKAWLGGELIQNAMPHLNDEEREFLISGMFSNGGDNEY